MYYYLPLHFKKLLTPLYGIEYTALVCLEHIQVKIYGYPLKYDEILADRRRLTSKIQTLYYIPSWVRIYH